MKTVTLTLTEAELETIGAAMDDYMAYADDEFASAFSSEVSSCLIVSRSSIPDSIIKKCSYTIGTL